MAEKQSKPTQSATQSVQGGKPLEAEEVITIDVGTQSCRAFVINAKGEIVHAKQVKYTCPYFSPQPREAEQKPNFYYEQICQCTSAILKENPDAFKKAKSVTITTIRDTMIFLDKDNKPLTNIIVWLDERMANSAKIPSRFMALFNLIGFGEKAKMLYRVSRSAWMQENKPDLWKKVHKMQLLSGWLTYQFTGEMKDAVASVVGHVPFDYKNRRWHKASAPNKALTPYPDRMLVPLVETGDVLGKITAGASRDSGIPEGLPLIATGTDKGCETIGLGVMKKNQAAISLGSAVTIQFNTPRFFNPEPVLPSYQGVIPGMYNPEYQIFRGFWLVSWFKEQFGQSEKEIAKTLNTSVEQVLDKLLADVPPCCGGLMFMPLFTPGLSNPYARGAFIGMNETTTKAYMYRALIEGIAFDVYKALKNLEKRGGQKITEVLIGGGGSQSKDICQIISDVLGLTVKTLHTHEASAIGSSMVAFVSQGVFSKWEDAASAMCHTGSEFTPNLELHKVYDEFFHSAYENLEATLTPTHKRIFLFSSHQGK